MDLKYMKIAIEEAKQAAIEGEIPVGCVIVYNDIILATTHNQKEKFQQVTKHAEIIAVEKASLYQKNWRLEDCDVYITLEPCPMCASALKQARVKNIYCGLANSDPNNLEIVSRILLSDKINPSVNLVNNLAKEEVLLLMKQFFKNRRNQ